MGKEPGRDDKTLVPPKIAGCQPYVRRLEPGHYSWCSCGYSKNQPFCDECHKDPAHETNRRPYKFQLAEELRLALCLCKHTSNPPFCDRTHVKLKPETDGAD